MCNVPSILSPTQAPSRPRLECLLPTVVAAKKWGTLIADVSSLNGIIVIELSSADKFPLDSEREKRDALRNDLVTRREMHVPTESPHYPSLRCYPPKSDRSYARGDREINELRLISPASFHFRDRVDGCGATPGFFSPLLIMIYWIDVLGIYGTRLAARLSLA